MHSLCVDTVILQNVLLRYQNHMLRSDGERNSRESTWFYELKRTATPKLWLLSAPKMIIFIYNAQKIARRDYKINLLAAPKYSTKSVVAVTIMCV